MSSPRLVIDKLLEREDNKTCADCPAKRPNHVNVTHGTFVCGRCAGLLRSLGSGVRIKTLSGSSFSALEAAALARAGNGAAAAFVAAHDARVFPLPAPADDARMLAFLREKYVHRTWFVASASALPPGVPAPPPPPKKPAAVVMASEPAPAAASAFSLLLPPPPSHSQSRRVAASARTAAVAPSVDDLFGLDFGSNYSIPLHQNAVAETATPSPSLASVSETRTATPVEPPASASTSALAPLPVASASIDSPSIAALVDDSPAIVSPSVAVLPSVVAQSTSNPSKEEPIVANSSVDVLFSWDQEPIIVGSETLPAAAISSALDDDVETLTSTLSLEPVSLQPTSAPLATINPENNTTTTTTTSNKKVVKDILSDLMADEYSNAPEAAGMGSLLELALQGVQQKPEDILIDLKSLDLGSSLSPVTTTTTTSKEDEVASIAPAAEPAKEETIKSVERAAAPEASVIRASILTDADILGDLDGFNAQSHSGFGKEEEDTFAKIGSVLNTSATTTSVFAPSFDSIDVMDNPWG
ncbi:hypothetical protein BDR26DRAFT_1009395 [Obelidium mucronatum]|nr:hypothetical protein BDR26DRAFT_1009395 [Obelidium mucronatum]